MNDLSPLIAFEAATFHYQIPPPQPLAGLVARLGNIPFLFSAPHACQHKRAGYWKQEDEYTGTLAEWLHRLTSSYALYITHRIDPDPHDDSDQNIYKTQLAELVQRHQIDLVIDLHGVKGSRDFGVAVGSMNGRSCPKYEAQIIQAFQQHGFQFNHPDRLDRLVLNHPHYTGGLSRPTITQFVSQVLGKAAVQIEINAWIRVVQRLPQSTNALENNAPQFRADANRFWRVVQALGQITQKRP